MTDMPLMDPSLSISHRRLDGWLLRHFYNMGNGIRAVFSVLAAVAGEPERQNKFGTADHLDPKV